MAKSITNGTSWFNQIYNCLELKSSALSYPMALQQIAEKKLHEIYELLYGHYQEPKDIGVLTGSSGIALFFFYYSKLTKEEEAADKGVYIIQEIINQLNNGYSLPSFCSGIAGAAWAIDVLEEEDCIELDTDTFLVDLDDYLVEAKPDRTTRNFYDFLHGLLGIAFYFFKRFQKTKSSILKKKYKGILLAILGELRETAQTDGNLIKWESFLIHNDTVRGYNLSLSHGISSIVNFLSRIAYYDAFKPQAEELLVPAVNYILSTELNDPLLPACFPAWVINGELENQPTRLAWCYGDLGIGISLWHAAQVLDDETVKKKALYILELTTKRRDLQQNRLLDAGLCHGTFGVAHIYRYMHKETGLAHFKETSEFWLEEALKMDTHKDGYAGYMQWRGDGKAQWRKETNLLEGVAGIGLALISYLAPFETKWDQCLLIG